MSEDLSLTHRAYVQIRAALISCRLAPGSRLSVAQLQRDIDVSQAAVREALSRLTAEGLAVIERNSGFRAAPVSVEGYRDLADACITLELPLLRSSICNGDYVWEGALLSCYHVASRVLTEVTSHELGMEAYVAHREEFYRRLFSACDNQWLLWSWSLLYAQQLRFRHTLAELAQFERGLHDDYREFLNVVLDRDVERAVELWCYNHDKIVNFIEAHLTPDEATRSVDGGAAPVEASVSRKAPRRTRSARKA